MSNHLPEPALTFEAALARYERPLIQYAMGLASGDLDLARDLVQDTFLRLARAPEMPAGEHLPAWLFTVCRNRAHDHYRKNNRLIYLEKAAMEDSPDNAAAPSAVMEMKENAHILAGFLERLPENQREVIRLKFQQDLSYREISEITTLSIGNVGFLLHTGLRKLRKLLQENDQITLNPRKIG